MRFVVVFAIGWCILGFFLWGSAESMCDLFTVFLAVFALIYELGWRRGREP